MASYLLQLNYSPEAWAAMIKNPQNRMEAVRGPVANLGGTITNFWMCFGEYDIAGVIEMPDNVSAAAFSMAIAAGGACHNIKTTALLSIEDGIAAMKKAATCGYKAAR
jgi:uncharacterized protein with GYD domain